MSAGPIIAAWRKGLEVPITIDVARILSQSRQMNELTWFFAQNNQFSAQNINFLLNLDSILTHFEAGIACFCPAWLRL